jgi:hypothetical protein
MRQHEELGWIEISSETKALGRGAPVLRQCVPGASLCAGRTTVREGNLFAGASLRQRVQGLGQPRARECHSDPARGSLGQAHRGLRRSRAASSACSRERHVGANYRGLPVRMAKRFLHGTELKSTFDNSRGCRPQAPFNMKLLNTASVVAPSDSQAQLVDPPRALRIVRLRTYGLAV